MKKIYLTTLLILTCACATYAQEVTKNRAYQVVEAAKAWDNDSIHLANLDQEKLPAKVTGGVILDANASSFIIREHGERPVRSNMKVGLDFGGFLDFTITKHFAIQGQALITAEQNRFSVAGADTTTNHLWSVGLEMPVYFLGRFGNMKKGYVQFGGGPYTHFTVASNLGKKWTNQSDKELTQQDIERGEIEEKYTELYKLHSNYFGLAFIVGYEFPFGMQLNLKYNVSLSDIATFYNEHKGEEIGAQKGYHQIEVWQFFCVSDHGCFAVRADCHCHVAAE